MMLVAVVVVVSIGFLCRKFLTSWSWTAPARMTALAAVISAAIAAVVMGNRNYGSPSWDQAAIEAYSRLIESTPVLGLILEEHPALERRLRAAIAADQESRPTPA